MQERKQCTKRGLNPKENNLKKKKIITNALNALKLQTIFSENHTTYHPWGMKKIKIK